MTGVGLLATHALGTTGHNLSWPSTTAGCMVTNTITECYDAAGEGGSVTIKPGHYDIHALATVLLDHGGTLQGSCGKSIIDPEDQFSAIAVLADNVTIKCLTLVHAGVGAAAIVDPQSANLHIMNVTISDAASGIAVATTGAANGLQVTGSTIFGTSTTGIVADNLSDAMVLSGNTIRNTGSSCIDVGTSSNSTVTKNKLTACDGHGVSIAGGTANTITNNTVQDTDENGIVVSSSATTISGNKVAGAYGTAIASGNVSAHADSIVVKSNTVTDSGTGITVFGATPDIEGNNVTGSNSGDGIDVDCTGSCETLKVVSNTSTGSAYGCTGIFVDLGAPAPGGLVSKNTVADNSCFGIEVRGDDVSYGGLVISNNKVTGNGSNFGGQGGIILNTTSSNTISGNTATGNGGMGFWLITGDANTFSKNTAKGNSLTGFGNEGSATNTTFDKNTASANVGDGFNSDSHTTVFTNNTASGSLGGDCTYDTTEDSSAPLATAPAGNKCADGTDFTTESLLTDE
jgi:parallel beta-helix repeat protein